MAVFQSVFGFFLPNQRRRPSGGGGGAPPDPSLAQVTSEIDQVLEDLNAPAKMAEFIKSDLEDAFTAKSTPAPGFFPGRRPVPLKISPFDLARDPLNTLGKAFTAPLQKSWQELLLEPTGEEIGRRIDKEVWNRLFDKVWTRGKIPYSLQQVVDRWIDRKDIEPQRRGVVSAFQDNPGLTFMMAAQLERLDPSLILNGVPIGSIRRASIFHEQNITAALAKGDWIRADSLQEAWKKASGRYRKDLRRSFEAGVKGGLIAGPEAQLWQFWKARNLHYGTLNFLRTYKKKGVWGVIQFYGWEEVKKRLKYSELTKVISAKILGPLGLNRLANLAYSAQRTIKNLTSGLVKKGALWVLEKLGLKAFLSTLGGALGSIVPGAGTAIGAIIGAVTQFVAEVVVEKLGGVMKIAGYAIAGAVGSFVLFAVAVTSLIAIILSNTPYPWEQGGSAAAAQRFVQIEIAACESGGVCAAANYQNPLRVSNGRHSISWRVVIRNISSQTLTGAEFAFSQSQCTGSGAAGFEIAPGAERVVFCSSSFTETDEVVSNVLSFSSAEPISSEEAVGIVIFGTPPITVPTGWPVARGCLTQGPNGSYSHSSTEAIDIGGISTGTAVVATFSGVVQRACWAPGSGGCSPGGYGNYVRVSSLDGSFSAVFAHLATVRVNDGDRVVVGQQLGTVNNTGNSSGTHLHYEFRGLPMSEPFIPRATGGNGSIRGCSEAVDCDLCF